MNGKNGRCLKCEKKDEELFPYYILPQLWYHGAGEIVWLCRDCITLLNKQFPLETVLSTKECVERVNTFLCYIN